MSSSLEYVVTASTESTGLPCARLGLGVNRDLNSSPARDRSFAACKIDTRCPRPDSRLERSSERVALDHVSGPSLSALERGRGRFLPRDDHSPPVCATNVDTFRLRCALSVRLNGIASLRPRARSGDGVEGRQDISLGKHAKRHAASDEAESGGDGSNAGVTMSLRKLDVEPCNLR